MHLPHLNLLIERLNPTQFLPRVGVRTVAGTTTFKREKLKIYEHAKDAIQGIPDGSKLLVGGVMQFK